MNIAGVTLRDVHPVGGGDIARAVRATAPDGTAVFAKTLPTAPSGLFAAEVRGLDSLRTPGGPPVPAVKAHDEAGLVLEWVAPGPATVAGAERAGRALATMHRCGARAAGFGTDEPGFIATLRQPAGRDPVWGRWWAEFRLLPLLRHAADRHVLDRSDRDAIDAVVSRIDHLAGPGEPPARVHGDLWGGNLLWAADGEVWLVDGAAAHDGHRETDLAMLSLFGAPSLDRLIAAYDDVYPLAPGWRERLTLHQVYPLLVHAVLFGGGYARRCGDAARTALVS